MENLIYINIVLLLFFQQHRKCWMLVNVVFCMFGVLNCKLLFLMRLSDSVSFSVYTNIILRCFYICWKMSRSLNKCLYELFYLWLFVISCPPPIPSPASRSKFPSRGEKKHVLSFIYFFYDVYAKSKKCTKMITSCNIRRVGRRWSSPWGLSTPRAPKEPYQEKKKQKGKLVTK